MKKVAGLVSLSLWAAALAFAPAPAEAVNYGRYPQIASYFAVSQYRSASQTTCFVNDQPVYFNGYMNKVTPSTSCSGSCNGSTSPLFVDSNIGNGRKSATFITLCGNGYVFELGACSTCN